MSRHRINASWFGNAYVGAGDYVPSPLVIGGIMCLVGDGRIYVRTEKMLWCVGSGAAPLP